VAGLLLSRVTWALLRLLVSICLLNVDRFLKLFHWHTLLKMCEKYIIKDLTTTTPEMLPKWNYGWVVVSVSGGHLRRAVSHVTTVRAPDTRWLADRLPRSRTGNAAHSAIRTTSRCHTGSVRDQDWPTPHSASLYVVHTRTTRRLPFVDMSSNNVQSYHIRNQVQSTFVSVQFNRPTPNCRLNSIDQHRIGCYVNLIWNVYTRPWKYFIYSSVTPD